MWILCPSGCRDRYDAPMRKLSEAEIARAKDPRDKVYVAPEKSPSTPPWPTGGYSVLLDAEYVFVDRESYERVCALRGIKPARLN
jgi:hypothetical protein